MTEYAISYGKAAVPVLPAAARRARRRTRSSPRTSRVEVLGDNFLPAYTEGDNSMVVATDSIKNLILRETGSWTGATLESLLHHLGGRLLADYAQMAARAGVGRGDPLRPGRAARDAARAGARRRDDRAAASWRATDDGVAIADLRPAPARDRAAEADRQRLHRLRARRLHDAARAPRPAALGRPRRRLALPRPAPTPWGAAPRGLRRRPRRCATSARPSSRTSSASRSSTSSTRWARGCSSCCPSWPRSRSRRATSPATRWSRASYTDPFPAHGTITLTMRRDERPAHHPRARHRRRAAGRRRAVTLRREGAEVAQAVTNADGRTDAPLLEGEASSPASTS